VIEKEREREREIVRREGGEWVELACRQYRRGRGEREASVRVLHNETPL
jgi:hypothetical protein